MLSFRVQCFYFFAHSITYGRPSINRALGRRALTTAMELIGCFGTSASRIALDIVKTFEIHASRYDHEPTGGFTN